MSTKRMRFLVVVLALTLVFGFSVVSFAYSGGDGSSGDPYQIATPEDLIELSNNSDDWDAYFIQTSDIVFDSDETQVDWDNSGSSGPTEGFSPIGHFIGVFNGQGNTIENLYIDRGYEGNVGLFGYADAMIENVGLTSAEVTGSESVGGLVGHNFGMVTDSYATGKVSGGPRVGGLVGHNNAGTVRNSYATCNVTAQNSVGGLVGNNDKTVVNSYATGDVDGSTTRSVGDNVGGLVGINYGRVSDSHATGKVSGDHYVGGFVGQINDDSTYEGMVSDSHATGKVSGEEYVGGFVGRTYGYNINEGPVNNSYATGEVSGTDKVGGLVGYNEAPVNNSYATGEVSGDDRVGGLVGYNKGPMRDSYATGSVTRASGTETEFGGFCGLNKHDYSAARIENSYSTGDVKYEGHENPADKGFVGVDDGGTYKNNFFDKEASNQSTATGATGKSTTEMKDISTFEDAGWDIEPVSASTDDYAYLAGQDNGGNSIWLQEQENTPPNVTYEKKYVQVEHSRWSMVSAPLEPASNDPTAVFKGVGKDEFYHWNPGKGAYDTPADDYKVSAFQGSWIFLEESQVSKVFTIPGVYSGNVTITLENPGWHQVGSPLDYGWSDIGVTKEGEDTMTIAQQASGPASPHWMSRFIWDYETTNEAYTAYDASSENTFNLKPGKAYWVKTYEPNVKLILPYAAPPGVPTDTSTEAKGIPMNSARADRLDVPNPPSPPETYSVGQFDIQVTPNPVTNNDRVTFIAAGSKIDSFRVNVYDASGKQIHASRRQSDHTYTWKPESNLSNGLYLYQVTAQKSTGKTLTEVGKLLVLQ